VKQNKSDHEAENKKINKKRVISGKAERHM
jgi:hypothetical protein